MSPPADAGGLDADVTVAGRVAAAVRAEPGEVVALIGPNGAGKSSVVAALAGLAPATGHAHLDGVDLLGLPVPERRVGLVFQDRRLFPHLDAAANVAFGPRSRGVDRRTAVRTARAWLDRLGVGDLAHRRPGELSGGQAQRVAIARALAGDPRLLLLDEPMAGLDVRVATALRIELAGHLRGFGGVSLLVTHDAIDALTVADRLVVLDRGRVAQTGPPAYVAQHPLTEHVARLVGLNLVPDGDDLVAFGPEAVALSPVEPVGSARLRWRGAVADVVPHGGVLRILVTAAEPGPVDLIADVTPDAATELGLAPGRPVWLAVKATGVRRYSAAAAVSGPEPMP